jgi:hypothetical protein
VSPSGTGVKLFVRGKLPPGARSRKGDIEMYSTGRYFTVTGAHLPGSPVTVEDRQDALLRVYDEVFGEPAKEVRQPRPESAPAQEPAAAAGTGLADAEVVSRAMRARNGDKFARLWGGDTSGYASDSEADLALCGLLAFWVGSDGARVEQLFGQSALGQREKWRARADYREETIAQALAGQKGFFAPLMQTRGTRTTSLIRIHQEEPGTQYTGEVGGGGGGCIMPSPEVVQEAVRLAVDLADTLGPQPVWRSSFVLARRLRCVWEGEPEAMEKAAHAFSERAGCPAEEFYLAFLDCWPKVKFREGEDIFAWAARRVEAEPIQLDYCPTPKYGLVASLAWYLGQYQHPETFWLPRERVAELLDTDPSTVSRIVSLLVKKGVIACVREDYNWLGNDTRAKEYLFVATPAA